ncbi:MAG: hypothetical protein VB853_05215 [Pirellulales bacterium]
MPKQPVRYTANLVVPEDAATTALGFNGMTPDTINLALSIAFVMVCFITSDVMTAGG